MMQNSHVPVLLQEAIAGLDIKPGKYYLDATFGQGGHTAQIIQQGGKVIGLDWDKQAIADATSKFETEIKNGQLQLRRVSFTQLDTVAPETKISGILFDFGTNTAQLTSSERGFSFEGTGPLDMRMDDRLGVQAKDLLALVPPQQLAKLFFDYGGEKDAWKIAQAIKRNPTPITTVEALTAIISSIKGRRKGKLNPATKVFQSLRIAVNREIDNIEEVLPKALQILESGGRIITIAFHEGEDRLAKHTFREWEEKNLGQVLTKKAITPTEEEVETNPRARSAKLRIFEKV
jgi:16S rRNA (cytosine1402-N4)-methyltransferase